MYTQCPNCNTTFRLSAEQMNAAHGQVCCGKCMKVFDAVRYLRSELPVTDTLSSSSQADENLQTNMPELTTEISEPALDTTQPYVTTDEGESLIDEIPQDSTQTSIFDVPAQGHAQALERNQGQAPEQAPQQDTEEDAPTEPGEPTEPLPDASLLATSMTTEDETVAGPSHQTLNADDKPAAAETPPPDEDHPAMNFESLEKPADEDEGEHIASTSSYEDEDTEEVTDESAPETAADEVETKITEAEAIESETSEAESSQEPIMPYFLLEQPGQPRLSLLATLTGIALVLLLSVLAASQYVYHQRDNLARNPEFKPWLEQMCEIAKCTLTPHRDTTAFELLERNVRFHPGREDALLISASFINHADFSQPYPNIELILKNMEGKVVAQRRFQPKEYFNSDQLPEQGIAAQQEAALLLEVSDPGLEAVSFEFNFL